MDTEFDLQKVKKTLIELTNRKEKIEPPNFHGGEPLIIGHDNLESLAKIIFDKWGRNNIQTNGILIDDRFIEIFKRYNFHVGFSIDGDTPELNRGRWNMHDESEKFIEKMTGITMINLRDCANAGLRSSVISVLRKHNIGDAKRLNGFIKFLDRLETEYGIYNVKTNPCIGYTDKAIKDDQPTNTELTNAFFRLFDRTISHYKRLTQPFRYIIDMLIYGNNNTQCGFWDCDPFYTTAEIAINHQGIMTNCLKSGCAIDGIQSLRADKKSSIRTKVLKQIPVENNGCKDCPYWFLCMGGCPGEGVENDFRNRTRFCQSWKELFEYADKKLIGIIPNIETVRDQYPAFPDPSITMARLRRSTWQKYDDIENADYSRKNKKKNNQIDISHGDSHNDRHGDKPHGDHTDKGR
jgi:uncharacterized protein